jgi:hypothetical protein
MTNYPNSDAFLEGLHLPEPATTVGILLHVDGVICICLLQGDLTEDFYLATLSDEEDGASMTYVTVRVSEKDKVALLNGSLPPYTAYKAAPYGYAFRTMITWNTDGSRTFETKPTAGAAFLDSELPLPTAVYGTVG